MFMFNYLPHDLAYINVINHQEKKQHIISSDVDLIDIDSSIYLIIPGKIRPRRKMTARSYS